MFRWSRVVAVVPVLALAACASVEPPGPWPSVVAPIEKMRTTAPMRLAAPKNDFEPGNSTVVLLLHVGADGRVLRSRVEETSGPRIAELAMHAMRETRFVPHRVGDVPAEVTVVARMSFPFRDRVPR